MKTADWYFDFISPFAYLQSEALGRFDGRLAVRPVPVLFAGLLRHWGQKGPAEMMPKRRFTYRQVQWLAEKNGIPLRFPPQHPFNPVRALRLAVALDASLDAIHEIFRFIWREGRDINAPEAWAELARRLDVADLDARCNAPEVKDRLRQNGEEALAAGVFGVPTLAVGGELFWGFDAGDMALDYLADPARFSRGEYARLDDLPVGAARKEAR
ncbi:MAG: 2-hydroxychromene-2-carboxylate isomerase [Rhodocyclaceae bacterium]|jgi:2-hydroxychromene-2-carboxylate isomerase|nr:2-hydroxychromene-2-carboxylate isomerase [Rhodocyclaceae bacterium]